MGVCVVLQNPEQSAEEEEKDDVGSGQSAFKLSNEGCDAVLSLHMLFLCLCDVQRRRRRAMMMMMMMKASLPRAY